MGDLREPNVAVTEERPVSPSTPSPSNPSPSLIGAERWAKAEQATRKIIYQVQPTDVSEERRRKVIEYVQRLITGCLGCEVRNSTYIKLNQYKLLCRYVCLCVFPCRCRFCFPDLEYLLIFLNLEIFHN